MLRVIRKGLTLSFVTPTPFTNPTNPPTKKAMAIDPTTDQVIRTDKMAVIKLTRDPTVRSKPLTRITIFCESVTANRGVEKIITLTMLGTEEKAGEIAVKAPQIIKRTTIIYHSESKSFTLLKLTFMGYHLSS